jgi:hypothetical protein
MHVGPYEEAARLVVAVSVTVVTLGFAALALIILG